jgi:DNA polymerase-3 subunit delta'
MAKAASTMPELDPRRTLTLDQLLGNEPLCAFLRRAWREGRLPQSLLLAGPQGLGKTSMAYGLAREIVAEGEDPATHPRALKVERGTHPDLIALTGKGSVSGIIPVDAVREMESRISMMPLEAPRKIVVIEPAEALNISSANALLKLLEEPPRSALFILISSDPNRLLTTIRSRCTVLELRPVPLDQLTAWLERGGAEPGRALLAAMLAEGRPGLAKALLEGGALEQRAEILRWLMQLGKEGFAGLFGVAERFAAAPGGFGACFQTAMILLRDALTLNLAAQAPGEATAPRVLNHDLVEELRGFAQGRSAAGLLQAAEQFERAAAEAAYFYAQGSKLHFCECLLMQIGPALRSV